MTEERIRLLVVEDHTVVRKGLCALLSAERYGCEVVGEAADGEEAIVKAEKLKPDVILMDLQMPKMGGIEATREIVRRDPQARVLVLTSFNEQARVSMALKVGAMGYILKESTSEELVHAIHSVYLNQVTIPAALARAALGSGSLVPESPVALPQPTELTERELDVLRGIAQGLSNHEIGSSLSISSYTVRSHVSSILSKLHLENRTQAATYAIQIGLFKPGTGAT
jgi:NarL family two-component system response regulator LiaR